MTYVRSASLRGFRTVVAELGGDADDLAQRVGLAPECLDQDDTLVPGAASAAMLEFAAQQLDCPDLGLRIAARQSVSVVGALSIALAHSPTFGDALETVDRYLFAYARFASLRLVPDPLRAPATVALAYAPASPDGPIQAVDLGLGFIHRGMAFLNRGPYGLRGVLLPFEPTAPLQAYEDFYGVPITVSSPYRTAALLRIPESLPRKPLTDIDETVRRLALAYLDRTTAPRSSDIAVRTKAAIQQSLGTGPVKQRAVARLLGLHPRTLQRLLAAHGTSYRQLFDDARRDFALQLITSTDLPLGYIATMCGFAEQASLSRASQRWWGTTAGSLRSTPSRS